MGFSFRNLIRGKPDQEEKEPEQSIENTERFEIADSPIENIVAEIYLRELAFQRAIQIIAKLLAKCEIRTFLNGEEIFRDEYYVWNIEPNRNQNKQQFFDKLVEKMFRNNEALIVEGIDGQIYVADSFCTNRNAMYGNTYSQVTVDDYTFLRTFRSADVMYLKPNWKNVNTVLQGLYGSYSKLIQYGSKNFLKSHGSKGILDISTVAQNSKNFSKDLEKLMNEYFKTFFESENAVLPLFDGYTFTEAKNTKNYNETTTRDIKALYDDIFDFTARAFGIPPSILKGNVQDNSKAIDELLTVTLDPLAESLATEINRKRYGKAVLKGSRCMVDTSHVKHVDLFSNATQIDKLVQSGTHTINMILRALGQPQINEDWADQHFITKNYGTVQNVLQDIEGGGESAKDGKNTE